MPQRRQQGSDYDQQVDEWHDAIARRWQASLQDHLPARSGRVALLVWGDPALYDSTLRIASRLGLAREQVRVVPGITSMQVLCSAHGIALNEIGEPFLITTGRQLRENGWPSGVNTLVVMLDGQRSYEQLKDTDVDIYWGAYLACPSNCSCMAGFATSRQTSPAGAPRPASKMAGSWTSTCCAGSRPLTLGCQGASVAWQVTPDHRAVCFTSSRTRWPGRSACLPVPAYADAGTAA
jgi:hypothetical protein